RARFEPEFARFLATLPRSSAPAPVAWAVGNGAGFEGSPSRPRSIMSARAPTFTGWATRRAAPPVIVTVSVAIEVVCGVAFGVFRYVTLPLLMPAIAFAAIFRAVDAFRSFDLIFGLTYGGPARRAEDVVPEFRCHDRIR